MPIRICKPQTLGVWAIVFATCVSLPSVNAQEIKENFLSSGVTQRVGGYRPSRAEMNLEANIVKVAPEDLESPKYGKIEIGGQSWAFILDEPEEGTPRLFIDTNNDGDLTNDPETEWKGTKRGEFTQFSGKGQVELGVDKVGSIGIYRFDPKDERREALKNTLMFYEDFGTEFLLTLDGQEFRTFTSGSATKTSRLPIDRDGNGQISRNFESTTVGEPFNFTGTTYVFTFENDKLDLKVAEEELPMAPMPPDLRVGKPALEFAATTMDGDAIEFPSQYAGKIVMLDFWATWCGPCIAEIPNMKEAYSEWHDKGFEILGVSFDAEDKETDVTEFLEKNELTWPQIYEGKGWETTIGNMHDVSGIPFVLLVDGDSGEILATSRQLRGEGLSKFIGEQLQNKTGE